MTNKLKKGFTLNFNVKSLVEPSPLRKIKAQLSKPFPATPNLAKFAAAIEAAGDKINKPIIGGEPALFVCARVYGRMMRSEADLPLAGAISSEWYAEKGYFKGIAERYLKAARKLLDANCETTFKGISVKDVLKQTGVSDVDAQPFIIAVDQAIARKNWKPEPPAQPSIH